jgi:hypothetical protein
MRAAAISFSTLLLAEGSALACPACAGGRGGSPTWLIGALIVAPIAIALVTGVIVRRLLARAP